MSFCKFTTTSNAKWVGLDNYVRAFKDASFVHAFGYTALVAVTSLVIINILAFAVAYALTRGIRGSNLFRGVFFMPNLIGGIVLGYIWSMIFDGFLSRYNTSIVLNATYGYWGLIIMLCWQQIGYMMIIYIAGLQSVSDDMIEAAKIDGANGWHILWNLSAGRHHHPLHRNAGAQHLQHLLPQLQLPRHGPGQGRFVLHPGGGHRARPAARHS